MPRYFFDVKNGHRLIDPSGLGCRDDHDARQKAIVIAGQIAEDSPASVARHVAVLNSERQEVTRVKIIKSSEGESDGGQQASGGQRPQGGGQKANPAEDQARWGDRLDEA